MNDEFLGKVYEFKATPTWEKYYSDDTLYGVYAIETETDLPKSKPFDHYDFDTNEARKVFQTTLVGKTARLSIGVEYEVKAKLDFSAKYKTFNYSIISVGQDIPQSVEDQRKFLSSICTSLQVESLLGAYPNIVQDIIDGTDNVDLSKTKYIKEHTYNLIKTRVLENYVIADILVLLIPLGVSYAKIKRLLSGEQNPHVLRQKLLDNPYVLTDIPGLGFKSVDRIAIKINPDLLVSKKRTIAFIKHHLEETGNGEGHTWITLDKLESAIKENVIECEEVYREIVEEQKEFETFLHIDGDRVGWKHFYDVEVKIFDILNSINNSKPLEVTEEEIESGIKKAEEKQKFLFTQEQREILKNATQSNLVFITGKAGVGKTTIARGLLNIYSSKYKIATCALSAKASKRISELSGYDSSTIHRLLGATGPYEFTYNENNPLPFDLIYLDEASMVFSGLFYNLIRAIKPGAKLIVSGDFAQLPPLNWGNPFTDYLQKDKFNIFYLTKILRQAERSGVVTSANLIRDGIDPLNGEKHFKSVYGEDQNMYFLFRSDKEDLHSIAIKTYLKTIEDPEIGVEGCCILSSRKDGCLNSSRKINEIIQNKLISDDVPSMEYGKSKKFKIGARVMQVVNSYDKNVFNGDVGTVRGIVRNEDGDECLEVEYPESTVLYTKEDLNELELAYSFSIHKSQGSEYHTVIIVLDSSGFLLLDNCLLYTAVSRSKTRCLLLSDPYSYDKCISINKGNNRNTWTKYF